MNIPKKLSELIESGFWPNKENISQQNEKPLVDFNLIKEIIPDENEIYFFNPPFLSIQELIDKGDDYYLSPEISETLKSIDPTKCFVIGDFGYGSEAELILDYSINSQNPQLKRLKWLLNEEKYERTAQWVLVTETFDEFIKKLKI